MPECSTFGDAKSISGVQAVSAWSRYHPLLLSTPLMPSAGSLTALGLQKGGFPVLYLFCTYLRWFFCKE